MPPVQALRSHLIKADCLSRSPQLHLLLAGNTSHQSATSALVPKPTTRSPIGGVVATEYNSNVLQTRSINKATKSSLIFFQSRVTSNFADTTNKTDDVLATENQYLAPYLGQTRHRQWKVRFSPFPIEEFSSPCCCCVFSVQCFLFFRVERAAHL